MSMYPSKAMYPNGEEGYVSEHSPTIKLMLEEQFSEDHQKKTKATDKEIMD